MYAEVIIDIKNKQVNRAFDYHVPPHFEGILAPGSRVIVPFGPKTRTGYVLKLKDTTDVASLKDILDVIDIPPVLNEEFVSMAKYISEHDFAFYATSLETMIPQALRMKYKRCVRKLSDDIPDCLKDHFKRNGEILLSSIPQDEVPLIFDEVKKGNLALDYRIKKNLGDKKRVMVHVMDYEGTPSSKKGTEALEYLEEMGSDMPLDALIEDSGYTKAVYETLKKNGFISTYEVMIEPEEDVRNYPDKPVTLNELQKKVYESLVMDKEETYLLHGVTGSGKTELYMHWISDVIEQGKTALMLVPEIALTPQITAVFYARFKENIAVLHSRLSVSEKYEAWKRILSGNVKIVVGARSAIFAPLKNLGIIIIDECHEGSYRQSNNPKYDALELAKIRSHTYGCPLVLGSATPRVTDYYMALEGGYKLLSLPVRANGKKLPASLIVDMRSELMNGNRTPISSALKEKMEKCYKRGEQAILFLNRRGYSSFVQCRSCGEAVKCPHCSVSLTYHSRTNTLKCHYCGYTAMNVTRCTSCGSDKIRYVGSGTEKIEEAVKKILPEARILRLDADTATSTEAYEEVYHKFKCHEADILIGTQMVTKGLDFDDVTLVGVLNADLALHYPSFDASEVAFDLIEQVSGRAGRSELDGEVVVQTYDPDSSVIKAAAMHDYTGFYNHEIESRKVQLMPPFAEVLEIEVSGRDVNQARKEASHIASSLREVSETSVILGPAEAYMFKKKDVYHFVISIQAAEDAVLDKIKYIYPLYQNNKDISISISRK